MSTITKTELEENFYPHERKITQADAPNITPLWGNDEDDGIIPASLGENEGARVLLHGPPSVGKTTFCYWLLNAIATGSKYLDYNTTKTPCLFVSMDMSKGLMFRRWLKTMFNNQREIDFLSTGVFDVLDPMFKASQLYAYLHDKLDKRGYGLIAFDALRQMHSKTMNDDDTPPAFYETVRRWLPNTTTMFLHHTRKTHYTQAGKAIADGDEAALGSRFWTALATVSLSMQPINKELLSLDTGKSQAFPMLIEPMKLYLESTTLRPLLYDKARRQYEDSEYKRGIKQFENLFGKQAFAALTVRQQDQEVGKQIGVNERTARRYRQAIYL